MAGCALATYVAQLGPSVGGAGVIGVPRAACGVDVHTRLARRCEGTLRTDYILSLSLLITSRQGSPGFPPRAVRSGGTAERGKHAMRMCRWA